MMMNTLMKICTSSIDNISSTAEVAMYAATLLPFAPQQGTAVDDENEGMSALVWSAGTSLTREEWMESLEVWSSSRALAGELSVAEAAAQVLGGRVSAVELFSPL